MITGYLQRIFLLSITVLSLFGSLQAISLRQKTSLQSSQRNLEYTRPQAAIPFNTDVKSGTAVKVDFGSDYVKANNLKGDPSMLLEISSPQTALFTFNDSQFIEYQCPNSSCYPNSSILSESSELFGHFQGYDGNSTVQILSSNWVLRTQSFFISEYEHNATYLTGANETYGWIGLAASEATNFPSDNPLFSIYVDNTTSGEGWILFDSYGEWTDPSKLVSTIITGAVWQVNGVQLTINDKAGPFESATAIFDLQYGRNDQSSMVLPKETFRFLIEHLGTMPNTTCASRNCSYVGDIGDLPSIQFKDMVIPATAYMTDLNNGTYVSNFNESSTEWNIRGSVAVFGWKVLSQYYFVFQSSDNEMSSNISLYTRLDGTSPTKKTIVINNSTNNGSDSSSGGNTNNDDDTGNSTSPDSDQTGDTGDSPTGNSFFKSTGFYLLLIVLSMLIVAMVMYFVNKRRAMARSESMGDGPISSVGLSVMAGKNVNDSREVENEIRKGLIL